MGSEHENSPVGGQLRDPRTKTDDAPQATHGDVEKRANHDGIELRSPEHLTSSCRAAETLTGLRYGRIAVMTSYESATTTMRPASEIWSPARPRG
jgi:hypothetical protein